MDLAHFWNTSGAYQINQSLRFDAGTNAYLQNASLGIYGNTNTTISFWLKHSTKQNGNIFACGANPSLWSLEIGPSSSGGGRWLNNGGTINIFPDGAGKLRDPAAWYHIVLRQTGNQSTIFLNGVQTNNNNSNSAGTNTGWYIGNEDGAGNNQLDGYLAEFIHVDGTAYDPSYFGEFDSITGAWIPKEISGITYGTKGFYLKFDPSATNGIGHDHSGNGNNFTATGFSTSGTGTDVMSDTPTNNWCTLNPLNVNILDSATLTNGNLQLNASSIRYANAKSTFVASQFDNYCEVDITTRSSGSLIGVGVGDATANIALGTGNYTTYREAGEIRVYPGNVLAGTVASYTQGDVIGMAIDSTNVKFYKNGTLQGTYAHSLTGDYFAVGLAYNDTASAVIDFNFGQRAFAYTPPTGFKALNTANLPEPTIKKPNQYFDVTLYTGNGTNITVTNSGGFTPDMVWHKGRSVNYWHSIVDVVRGNSNVIFTNTTDAEANPGPQLDITTGGFISTYRSANLANNQSSATYVGWNWKANGAGSSNTAGTITSTVSANATAGFSIATYTGTGSNASFGHGLGVVPSMCIIKQRNTAQSWWVWHQALGNNVGANNTMLELNGTAATYAADDVFRGFTSSVVNIGTDSGSNTNGGTYVAYCFSEVAGYSKFGSYTGNGSTDGPFVFCGFRPKLLIWKRTDSTANWFILDAVRNTYNVVDKEMYPDQSAAESTFTDVDFLSNGFKLRASAADRNGSGATFIFAAWAELPFKYANAR